MTQPPQQQPPKHARWSNCLFFVLARLWKRGGYLIMRRSRHGWWPHFLWSQDLVNVEHYTPITPIEGLPCAPPLFRGRVRQDKAVDAP